MKSNKNIILFVFIFFTLNTNAANRYWIGGTGNWTTTSHWAATSGGTTDNVLPTSSDDIYIDALSGTGTITTSTNITVSYLDFMAGCSAITLGITANTFTVTNNFYQNTSATNSNTSISGGTLVVNGNININAGIFTATTGTINVNGTSFGINGGTANFNGSTINVGNSTNEFLRVYSGNLSITSGTINVKDFLYTDNGGLTISGGTINVGTGLSLDYWATVYLQGTNTISGGIINIQAVQTGGSSYAVFISGSTFSGGSTKINVTNANYRISSPTLYNLEINSSGVTASFYSTLIIDRDFTLTNGTSTLDGNTITTTNQTNLNGGTFQASSGTYNSYGTGACFAINGSTVNVAGATVNIGNSTDEILRIYSGTLNHSAGIINVTNYFMIDVNGSTFSGGNLNIGTGGTVSYTAFYIFGTGTFSGGTINVQSVQTGGSGIAVDISSGSTFSGGLIKVTATNDNYQLYTRKAFNLQISSTGKVATLMPNMTIYGYLDVTNGSLTSTSTTVTFNGSIAQSITGSSATSISLSSVTLNNASGLTIAPLSGIETTFKNTLTLTSGKITLGNYTLCIGATGISGNITGGTSTNYIITNGTGVLKQYNIGTGQRTSAFYPIGQSSTNYNPITLTISGASTVDNFGILVSQNVYTNGTSGSAFTTNAVNKTWYISEGTATGSSLTVTPQWNTTDELTNFTRASSEVRHYTGGVWNSEGGSYSGSNPYTITSGIITSFSPFGIFDPVSLPVQLLEFNAVKNGDKVDLNWSTASEFNNDYFKILKSIDGISFEEMEQIDGSGNSQNLIEYNTIDRNPFIGISYYQLVQIDFDGVTSFSEIRSVNFENESSSIYPNPSNGLEINISLSKMINKDNFEIKILDESGRIIHIEKRFKNTSNCIKLNLNNSISKGIYTINIESSNDFISNRLIIQ